MGAFTGSDGNKQWDKTFGGKNKDWTFSAQQTSDDGYIVAGYTESYGTGNGDIWVIKTDSEGNEQWMKTLGGKNNDGAYSVQQTSGGGYIVAGFTNSYGAGEDDYWLIKLNDTGGNANGVSPSIETQIQTSDETDKPDIKVPTDTRPWGLVKVLVVIFTIAAILWRLAYAISFFKH
ncbi:hypothetical protein ACT9XH_02330 [Methanococcoides methylutens]|uniref:hypothetical protein n=1 Tax=Methanococcoides methylutens TaxID=2226 RepID=UPI004043C61E